MEDKHMRKIVRSMQRAMFGGMALLIGVLSGCGMAPVADKDGRVYHCVATERPVPPPNTWSKRLPLEKFEYGDYVDENRPTISGSRYCNTLQVPKTAYLRYRVDGRVIEKRFDLSALTPQRVYKKDVEFYVDEDAVEVRLVTPVQGTWPTKEVIVRQ
jgi:hypothetical protein